MKSCPLYRACILRTYFIDSILFVNCVIYQNLGILTKFDMNPSQNDYNTLTVHANKIGWYMVIALS